MSTLKNTTRYAHENLFRKPYEYWGAASSSLLGTTILLKPHWFLPTQSSAYLVAGGLLAWALHRYRQGHKVVLFQAGLRRLPAYSIRPQDLPVHKKELFLGLGFQWTQVHTQRLQDARQPANRYLLAGGEAYARARERERDEPDSFLASLTRMPAWRIRHIGGLAKHLDKLGQIGSFIGSIGWDNPVAILPPVGGRAEIHGVGVLDERDVWTALAELSGHTLVLGTTRVGKTRLAEVLVAQDIRRGNVTIVFDPKGDPKLLQRMYAEAARAGREDNFWFFHLGFPEQSDAYNPLGTFGKITEVATRIASALPSEGQSNAFRDFVWRFLNVISRAGEALGDKPSYKYLYENATNIDNLAIRFFKQYLGAKIPNWKEDYDRSYETLKALAKGTYGKSGRKEEATLLATLITERGWGGGVTEAIIGVLQSEKSYFEKLVSSLYPLLEKLTTGQAGDLLSPDASDPKNTKRIIDWEKIIKTGGVVYFGLDALSDTEVASAVGNAAFADLTSTAGRIYKALANASDQTPSTTRIHADEFNELIGAEFIPLLNKAGGAGFQVTAYTQTWDDVEARLGNRAQAQQVGGNLNNLIMLRVLSKGTAEILTDRLPEVEVLQKTTSSSANDGRGGEGEDDFSAGTQDRYTVRLVPMLTPADIIALPKGQAFALIEGGKLIKLRLPMPDEEDDFQYPATLNEVARRMQAVYLSDLNLSQERIIKAEDGTDSLLERPLTVKGKGDGW